VRAFVGAADGSADPLLARGAEEAAPLGSAFKLYVLFALAQEIDAGRVSWGDELVVDDTVRSLPSGELQDEPNGTVVTVREAALGMISISDNTATDMLIHLLGRDRIEQAVADAGHHDPSLLSPFLTTRELFQIGWGDPALRERWDADPSARRALVDEIAERAIDDAEIVVGGDPIWPDELGWFASPSDLVRVHQALHMLDDDSIDEILTANPGVRAPGWDSVAFKGGSSLGVLTGSWLLEKDGDTYAAVIQTSTEAPAGLGAQEEQFTRLSEAAISLLAGSLS
jgi:hypothetical protein